MEFNLNYVKSSGHYKTNRLYLTAV